MGTALDIKHLVLKEFEPTIWSSESSGYLTIGRKIFSLEMQALCYLDELCKVKQCTAYDWKSEISRGRT